jgi:hypothetical protein
MTDAELLQSIEDRVRPTICETHNSRGGMTVEGRILKTDFDALLDLIDRLRKTEREECAQLFEQVDPASDDERLHNVPGAGAMGAVLQFRDLIRARL